MATVSFVNPATQQEVTGTTSFGWLWCLIFGPLYFAVKRIWAHFFISVLFAIFTSGISWLVYPFFANGIVRRHYTQLGYIPVVKTIVNKPKTGIDLQNMFAKREVQRDYVGMKKCSHCAELIRAEAQKCRFCGTDQTQGIRG